VIDLFEYVHCIYVYRTVFKCYIIDANISRRVLWTVPVYWRYYDL